MHKGEKLGDWHKFIVKTWGVGEAERVVISLEDALDFLDNTQRLKFSLKDRYVEAQRRLDKLAA